MKLPESWLRQWIDPEIAIDRLSEQLSLSGLETTIIQSEIPKLKDIVVGQIVEAYPHPNADRLQVCIVNCGANHEPKTIICGAQNAQAGLKVAVALPGAQLPNNFKIITRKIRGVQSEGMLCALEELDLGFLNIEKAKGIWELPQEFSLGVEVSSIVPFHDAILDVQVPPNRGDCLSVLGLSREIAMLNNGNIAIPEVTDIVEDKETTWPIHVEAGQACPCYMGRIIRGLNKACKTPLWIVNRLHQSGMRTIHPIVDITNYVLLEFGQPLHAFDLERISESLNIRFGKPGETLELLNNKTIKLNQNHLVVADHRGPQALAGIMGGLHSSVNESTVNIFLESAFFQPQAIRGVARQLGIVSEASYRFERGVDPKLCKPALEKATQLLLSIAGGKASSIMTVTKAQHLPKTPNITLRYFRIGQILGFNIPPEKVAHFLQQLSLNIISGSAKQQNTNSLQWQVQIPSWRFDLQEEIDLIEEISRCYGYEHIPEQLPIFSVNFESLQNSIDLKRLRSFWVNQGYYETIHYSFTSEQKQKLLNPNTPMVKLANPISQEMNVLRTHLWPNLLNTLSYHQHRQNNALAIFEIGSILIDDVNRPIEQMTIGGLVSGYSCTEQWGIKPRLIDIFDLKQVVHNSLLLLDAQGVYTYVPEKHAALQSGQSSRILKAGQPIGWIGALNPFLYQHFNINAAVYLFEYQLEVADASKIAAFQAVSRFPYMRRDLAFWVPMTVPFDQIEGIIRKIGGVYLLDVTLFDVYYATGNSTQRSLAVGVMWQHPTRTLTDHEVDKWQVKIVQALQQELHVQMRDQ